MGRRGSWGGNSTRSGASAPQFKSLWPVFLLLLATSALLLLSRSGGERAELLSEEKLLSKAHASHQKHRAAAGSKYRQELATVESTALPNRKEALAKLQRLKNRSEGITVKGGSHGEPAAVAEMENLARKRAHTRNGASGIGALARQHGIKSSKDMLAEIMSLRHYKKSNAEINNIANGFEAHSSFSNKVLGSISHTENPQLERQQAEARRKGAAALRLEAGRYTRKQMLKKTEAETEQTIGQALSQTLRPIQKLLAKDEKSLDGMVSRRRAKAEEHHAADQAEERVTNQMKRALRREASRIVHEKEVQLEHKSTKYLNKVHAKAKAALNKVVNPDVVSAKTSGNIAGFAATTAGGWSHNIDQFLKDTNKFMTDQWDGIVGPQKAVFGVQNQPTAAKSKGSGAFVTGGGATAIAATQAQPVFHTDPLA